MVAHALDNSVYAAVTEAKALTGDAANVSLATGTTIEGYVTDDDIFVSIEARITIRINDNLATGKPLANMVVSVALQLQSYALGQECAKALTSAALKVQINSIRGQAL